MQRSPTRMRRCGTILLSVLAGLIMVNAAKGSQGPGTGAGNASALIQALVAAAVYGGAGAIIFAGVAIGVARRLGR